MELVFTFLQHFFHFQEVIENHNTGSIHYFELPDNAFCVELCILVLDFKYEFTCFYSHQLVVSIVFFGGHLDIERIKNITQIAFFITNICRLKIANDIFLSFSHLSRNLFLKTSSHRCAYIFVHITLSSQRHDIRVIFLDVLCSDHRNFDHFFSIKSKTCLSDIYSLSRISVD